MVEKKRQTSQKSRTKRPTKEELRKQQAFKSFVIRVMVALVLFFAMLQMGRLGISAYNGIRLLVGSLAYPVMLFIMTYLLGKKWLDKYEGLVVGTSLILLGLLLEWQTYLATHALKGLPIFRGTLNLLLEDAVAFKASHFLGGGLLGALLYQPIAFLLSDIGAIILGVCLVFLGIFLVSPWDVTDIGHFFQIIGQKLIDFTKQQKNNYTRKQDEKRNRLAEKIEEIGENQTVIHVDMETGEILEDLVPEAEIVSHESNDWMLPVEEEIVEDEELSSLEMLSHPPLKSYKLPTIDLFASDKPKNQQREKKLVRENIKILEQTFASFGIKAIVERAEIGPSVTKYEVKPAVGVRVNRIANLADDLALALAAKDVRIEAPIPGKSLVGIEVPNMEVATVSFRELWEQSKTDPKKLLEIPLGKAVNGTAKTFDLSRMPHLLVAGSTGSGKSVAVNGIISSILMKARPEEVKLMMIDPKMVELSVYNDIPHLLIPVVTNPRKASRALQKVVDEMEQRYEKFSRLGVRNLEGYNNKILEKNQEGIYKDVPLPLLVVIVDELADLMMVASKEVEDAIIRLGQKARAAGIHMILATQRPSVDVISGLIKANVPSRVAFAVSSGTDSRTILDENGAEKLLGRGDMLFKPIDENHPIRLQGSFISDRDVERIVTFIKTQAQADYDEKFDPGEVNDDMASSDNSTGGDPLFEDAKALVIETQKASASMLQRRLSVGFNRATRLMEELEEAGVIGPAEGTKPRKVLQQ